MPSQIEPVVKCSRLYGAVRGISAALIVNTVFLLTPFGYWIPALLPLVLIMGALLGALSPGRLPAQNGTRRRAIVWLFAVLHIAVVVYATDCFGFALDARLAMLVKDADRIVVRDGGGLCHSDPDKEPSLFEITNKADIAEFNALFRFSGHQPKCKCCGYPGVDWWRDGKRIAVSAVHHGRALRVEGCHGDWRFTASAEARIRKWLEEHCGITKE